MAIELLVQKHFSGKLVPHTPHDEEIINDKVKEGPVYRAVLTNAKPRSVQQNRFYWAVLGITVENHPYYTRSKQLHLWLKVRMGYVKTITFHDGQQLVEVESTAFDKMGPDEFKAYLDEALKIITEEVIPNLGRDDLIREVESRLRFTYDSIFQENRR